MKEETVSSADAFQFDATHGVGSPETSLRIQNLQSGESAFAIVVSSKPFGQMFGRDRGFAERDAQWVYLRVVADFHSVETITFAR